MTWMLGAVSMLLASAGQPPPDFTAGTATPGCSPSDGPAMHLELGRAGEFPRLLIGLYNPFPPQAGGTYTVPSNGASASYCPRQNGCESLFGSVEISRSGEWIEGDLDAVGKPSGKKWRLHFRAHVTNPQHPVLCG